MLYFHFPLNGNTVQLYFSQVGKRNRIFLGVIGFKPNHAAQLRTDSKHRGEVILKLSSGRIIDVVCIPEAYETIPS